MIGVGAIPILHLPAEAFTVIGLILIGIGSGGIKPCVAAFGGDQFKIPEQAKQLASFFSFFYFSINAGSLISTTLTPILREDVHCFGDLSCFSLAFGVPGALMFVSIIIFLAGKSLYIVKDPQGNVIVKVTKCIFVSFVTSKLFEFLIFCNFRLQSPRNQSKVNVIFHIGSTTLNQSLAQKWSVTSKMS